MRSIKNLNINKGILNIICLTTVIPLTGCNKQMIDFNKNFNVAIETNGNTVSVVGIKNYSDYTGDSVQFITLDNLVVLSSTMQTELLNVSNDNSLNNYALALSGNKEENVVNYNELQNITMNYDGSIWNKDVIDLHYTFNKAIILSDSNATIVDIDTWTDYEEDDKIQIRLMDGTCVLTNIDRIKLVNDENANENSLTNYAVSLVGSSDNVIYYQNTNTK